MPPYDEDRQLAAYIFRHYAHLFTPMEKRGALAAFADDKAKVGSEGFARFIWKRHQLADDKVLAEELKDGIDAFRRRTAERVIGRHRADVFVNRCPRCGRVVATPKAQQCLWCGNDWHPAAAQASQP